MGPDLIDSRRLGLGTTCTYLNVALWGVVDKRSVARAHTHTHTQVKKVVNYRA